MVKRHYQLNGHEFEQTPKIIKDREAPVLQSMESQRVGHNLVTKQQQLLLYFVNLYLSLCNYQNNLTRYFFQRRNLDSREDKKLTQELKVTI